MKPIESSTKITFANAFDVEFSLLLRERRSISLLSMQEETIEVDSNILASQNIEEQTR
jgi:hypothetical protein